MKYGELNLGQVEAIINKLGGMDGVHRFLSSEMVVKTAERSNVYPLTINYERTVEDGVKAGKYDWTNNDITSDHFPSKEAGTKEVSVELIHFGKDKTTNEVLSELDNAGMRPATLKELLALSENHLDLQREFPIVALGSVWRPPGGSRDCACLYGSGSGRSLNLGWIGYRWDGHCRFAAVRK